MPCADELPHFGKERDAAAVPLPLPLSALDEEREKAIEEASEAE